VFCDCRGLAGLHSRREVLKAASVAAVGSSLGGLAAAAEVLAQRRVAPLSIGYLDGSASYPDFRVLPWQLSNWSEWGPPLEVVALAPSSTGC